MKTIHLQLTLQEPLVISQSNATEGSHSSLDYIPGATLLGALASKHYANLKNKDLAYEIFHSGKVRFKNGYPLIQNQASSPMPMSIYKDKMDQEFPLNHLQKQFTGGIQGKQQRKGYIAPKAQTETQLTLEPQKHLQMRTAIDANKGTAQESQLYGYQMLQANTQFVAQIDCDNDTTAQEIQTLLNDQKEIFIGRSRSAQYGRVKIDIIESTTTFQKPILEIEGKTCLVLWLASDMAVYDLTTGQPVLAPTLNDLGLESKGQFNSAKSYVRTRQYAPYNGKRRCYDIERQVLQQGSVLCYSLDSELSDADFEKLQKGLGIYTEMGLGQIVLNSHFSLLEKDEIKLKKLTGETETPSVTEPKTDLMFYLKQCVQTQQQKNEVSKKSKKLLEKVIELYNAARNYNGIKKGQAFGPTKTQWGALREEASKAKNENELHKNLFVSDAAFIKTGDEHWDISTGGSTLKDWLETTVNDNSTDVIRDLAYRVSESQDAQNMMEGK